MKKGDVVKFKRILDSVDVVLRMILLGDPEEGRVKVQVLIEMENPPIYTFSVEELKLA